MQTHKCVVISHDPHVFVLSDGLQLGQRIFHSCLHQATRSRWCYLIADQLRCWAWSSCIRIL